MNEGHKKDGQTPHRFQFAGNDSQKKKRNVTTKTPDMTVTFRVLVRCSLCIGSYAQFILIHMIHPNQSSELDSNDETRKA